MNTTDTPSVEPTTSTRALLGRLATDYIGRYKNTVIIAVLCMITVAITSAANAWLIQPALDEIFIHKNREMLLLIPAAIIVIGMVGAAASYGQTVLMRKVGQGIIASMQVDLFKHLLHSDLALFHDESSGKLISRFTNDIQLMRNTVSSLLTGLARESLTAVFLIGIMIYQSWQLSLIALVVFPIAFYPIIRLGKRMRKVADATQAELSNFAGQLDEAFSAVRVVKAYGREGFEVKRAESTVMRLYHHYMKASRIQAIASPMMELLGSVAIAGVIAYGGMQVIDGVTTPGAFFSFIAAMMIAYKPIRAMAGMNTQLQEGLAAARRLYAVLDTKPSVQEAEGAKALEVSQADIALEAVNFSYPDGSPALREVSMHIPAGKMAALVGSSGAGKSTVMNLLMRFYDLESGRITIDGQDIAGVTFASLRDKLALVSQEILLFDDTLRANIAYGKDGATQDEIEQVAKAAAAHDFIMELPQGYDTRIGPSGAKLSGGQRQRLSIARAMLKDAPILLLDEATSALDTASEKAVQKALDDLMQNRTTLVIAHRLSTIRHADLLYVMEGGQVVESGTHEALLANPAGAYAALYRAQFADASEPVEHEAPAPSLNPKSIDPSRSVYGKLFRKWHKDDE